MLSPKPIVLCGGIAPTVLFDIRTGSSGARSPNREVYQRREAARESQDRQRQFRLSSLLVLCTGPPTAFAVKVGAVG